ncbi:hypothetical protein [Vibrio gangliei]|uniref:hypothetical protein n=1 Tax=Vibrio gangliei TaxID=2077090 RepID=UPI000D01BA19|nr:hypothetical protein [Vibrio gangliei]
MLKIIMLIIITISLSIKSFAANLACSDNLGGFCTYTGKIERVYVNDNNLILIYFESPLSSSEVSKSGLNVTKYEAAAYKLTDNPDFAKLFYSTALTAQSTQKTISIQMYDVLSGYLKFDRIWLNPQ